MKKKFLFAFFLCLSFMAKSQTFITLHNRAVLEFKEQVGSNPTPSSLLSSQQSDGSWSGIDYEDNAGAGWDPLEHLENLAIMAKFYESLILSSLKLQYGQKIQLGLEYWYSLGASATTINCGNGPVSVNLPWSCNWWNNYIGKQRELQPIATLFMGWLSGANYPNDYNPDLLQRILNDFPNTVQNANNAANGDFTAANRAEVAGSIIIKAILMGKKAYTAPVNATLLQEAIDRINQGRSDMEFALDFASATSKNEGIQLDYSFHQHNQYDENSEIDRRGLLYSGGYGHSFLEVSSMFASILHGTTYKLDLTARTNLINYVLEGFRWMIKGDVIDFSTGGRYIARPHPGSNSSLSSDIINWIQAAAESDFGQEILDDLEHISVNNDNGEAQAVRGNKYFWKSDYTSQYEANYLSTIRTCSGRTIGTESINDENIKGYWLPYGCTFLYLEGDEYTNIFPFWDWTKIPGVTGPANILPELEDGDEPETTTQPDEYFVGSTSNGTYGVTTMQLDKTNYSGQADVSAKKSWFQFGEEIIALGTDIKSNDGNVIRTTINQLRLEDNAVVKRNNETPVGFVTESAMSTNWIHHNNTAYIFPGSATVVLSTLEDQSGDWEDIGTREGEEEGHLFQAWINHGVQPTAGNYKYVIVPGISSTQAPAYLTDYNDPDKFVFTNTTAVQAVKKVGQANDGLAGIVYYPANPFVEISVEVATGITLSASHPCVILFDESTHEICISSPDRDENVTSIQVTVTTTAYGTVDLDFELPSGEYAGTSVCKNLFSIAGNIRTYCGDGDGIADVQITAGNNVLTESDQSGNFSLENLQYLGDYTIDPSKDVDYLNGVSTYDIVLMSKHILGTQLLNSPYKIIAADVYKSGAITTFDMKELRKLILLVYNPPNLPLVESWEFVKANHVFTNPANPFSGGNSGNLWPFPQTASIQDLGLISENNNFIGIKMGDLNCSVVNNFTDPCGDEINLLSEDKVLRADETFTMALRADHFEDIAAYQFALQFDPQKLQYLGLQSGDLRRGASINNFGLSKVNEGVIMTSWLQNEATNPAFTIADTTLADTSSLFLIQFKALEEIPALSDVIQLKTDFLTRVWTDADPCGQQLNLQFMPMGYSFNRSDASASDEKWRNITRVYPNPTSGNLAFEIACNAATENTIEVYNSLGQLVLNQRLHLQKGVNTIHFEDISNWQDGMYYFTISNPSGSHSTGRFVKQ